MDVFDLFATLSLDTSDYDRDLNNAEKEGSSFGKSLKTGLVTAAKAGAAALATAGAAVTALVKSSVESYAEYEQLVGGVETLFKDSADIVQEYAANAYKTAGLSANEYMETVTSFSASLLQSLGGDTKAAAKYADRAIIDMSDNANKMGSSMEAIQNAYQGFAKQNYTMLDNLKLGYGGTKTEMERLITDAEALNDTFKATRDENGELAMSYADIVEAIHIVQTDMGITGTTAKEASTTIQGSLSAVKSAWSNLVTGVADENADFGRLISDFVDSAATVAENLLPRIEQALKGVGKLIEDLAPVILDALPVLISDVLPDLLSSAVSLLKTVVNAIVDNLPMLLQTAADLVLELALGISQALPKLIPTIVDIILNIVDVLIDNIDLLVDASIAIVTGLADGLINALPRLLEKAPEIIEKLVQALIRNVPKLLEAAFQIIVKLGQGIIDNLPQITKAAADILKSLSSGLITGIKGLGTAIGQIIKVIKEPLENLVGGALNWGKDMIDNFVNGIKNTVNKVKEAVSSVGEKIKNFLGFSEPEEGPLSNFHTYAPDMMQLFAKGIADNEKMLYNQIEDTFDFRDAIKDATGTVDLQTTGTGVFGGNENTIIELLREIAAKDLVEIMPDSDGIFNIVKRKNNEYYERTGDYAFLGG